MTNLRVGSKFDVGRSKNEAKGPGNISFRMKRVTFNDQAIKRGKTLSGIPLTAYAQVGVGGHLRFLRASDLLIDGKFDSKSPAFSMARAIEIVTPEGIVLKDPSVLNGLNPIRVDIYLAEVDLLRRLVADRADAGQIVEVGGSPQAASLDRPKIEFPKMIDDPRLLFRVAKGVIPGSKVNGERRAAEINEQHGSKLRIPTEEEDLMLDETLGNQLEGAEYWIWTATEHEKHPGCFVLRHRGGDYRGYAHPGSDSFSPDAVRFVEDR
jgi:hypothetical protein